MVVGLVLVAGIGALAACDQPPMIDKKIHYSATMVAASEVPPNASTGKGTADVFYDPTKHTLSWTFTYSGLTGPATAAHFHGPAMAGANAGVVVPVGTAGMGNPVTGAAQITDAQAADLAAGKWYANIHTAKNPGGEIRGQVLPVK
jgi:hypothetical protein